MAKDINRHFTEETIKMANKHEKRCSRSLASQEGNINSNDSKISLHTYQNAKIKNSDNTKCCQVCRKTKLLVLHHETVKRYSPFGKLSHSFF